MAPDLYQQLQATLGAEYALERELGGGGMSRVFLAEETRFGRRVVVKVLTPDLGAGLSADRFEREIRFAAQLQDPRIVPLLQAGHSDDLQYYTMPYIEGETLRDRLARAPIPLEEAVGILRDIALALEYAHARKVVHRDIKPENILLTGRTAVVADFGIAKAISDATQAGPNATLTKFGSIVGTPAYMAPEQAAGDAIDARSDLYAWGMIAYEMLTGVHPFVRHSTAQALLAAQISESPLSLGERRRDLPHPLTSLVDRCLSKDPSHRPADASEIVAVLGAALSVATSASRVSPRRVLLGIIAAVLVIGFGGFAIQRYTRQRWVSNGALQDVEKLNAADRPLMALQTLQRAQSYAPNDTQIARVMAEQTNVVSVNSTPSGATVSVQDYLAPEEAYITLGTTPLKDVRIPKPLLRWKVEKAGVGSLMSAPAVRASVNFALDSAVKAPPAMLRVSADTWTSYVAFIGWVGPYKLPAFYIDKFEVTNREYQAFVDKGGYSNPQYWKEPFVEHGSTISFDAAMARFRDRTGRAGPSTWEGGHFPDGKSEEPVSGVSWYEAAAYEEFAGKSLPAFAQWFEAAPPGSASYVVRASNIGKSAVASVGSFKGLGAFGTYDMAGNVREWTRNALDADRHFILGGAAKSQTYLYSDPEALSSFDRSPENGIRGVRNTEPLSAEVTRPVKPLERDIASIKPASDEVFRAYQVKFAYEKFPLNAKVDAAVAETRDWRRERVTFDAAYGNQRVTAYVFLPKRVKPPYQAVLFFPSARVTGLTDSRTLGDTAYFDYVVQSGRAVVYPIYQETYERRARQVMPSASQDIDISEQRYKDLARSIDYLQTRSDIDSTKLGYLGVSMGSAEGVIYTTLAQDRLKAVVLLDGGFFLDQPPVGADLVDYAPRLKTPTLMVNGRYDFTFSLEHSQLPLYRVLGAPAADKKHVILETPHDVLADRPALVREVLAWFDKYLGRVQ